MVAITISLLLEYYFMKLNLLVIALLPALVTSQVFAGPESFGPQQANINVTGTVMPATCQVMMETRDYVIDDVAHGALTNTEINLTSGKTLDYPFSIICEDTALVGFTLKDNQEGTAYNASNRHAGRFGLGKIDKKTSTGTDYKIGAWEMKISALTLDGKSEENSLLQWRPTEVPQSQAFEPMHTISFNPDHDYAFIRAGSGQQHNILAFKKMTGTIKTQIFLAPKSLEHVADEIDISGSATITIKYY